VNETAISIAYIQVISLWQQVPHDRNEAINRAQRGAEILEHGWPSSQRPRATFIIVLRKKPCHTHWHTWTLPHVFLTQTYLCSVRFIAKITHQHDNHI